jgi:Uma2 family endonuclease
MAVLEATIKKHLPGPDTVMQTPDDIEDQIRLLSQLDLPSEDGIPMETNWHRSAMNLLIDSVHALWHDRNDYFAGGNMFIYFSLEQVRRKQYRGPDFFVVNHVDGTRDRDSWIVWKEDGRYPDVIVELASPSTIEHDLTVKKDLYEQTFHTTDYFCYNPATRHLLGWHLANTQYEQLKPNAQGWLWSQQLNVWVGLWEGEFQRIRAGWPRLYTAEGQLVLTLAEAEAQRAEAEAQRAEAEAQRAEAEAQRAEAEAQRAEAEAQRAERFAAKLRELGIDPNMV